MTQTTDQERAEFEAWASNEFGYSSADFTQSGGRYILDHLYFGYQGWQAARRAQVVPAISEAQVLAITTAYEQGVGKGHQSHARKEAITNPYGDEWGCDSAWQMGYDEGREQAERKAAPQPPEAAPVELPEPVYTMRVRGRMHDYTPTLSAFDLADGEHELYTGQQVRQLLADHGIK